MSVVEDVVNGEALPQPSKVSEENGAAAGALLPDVCRKRLWRNIITVNGFVFFINLGFFPVLLLQTSLNVEDGLGPAALFIMTTLAIPVCFFGKMAVVTLGEKTLLTTAALGDFLFIAANFYPKAYILLPTAIVTGLGLGFSQVAHRSYTGQLGDKYSRLFDTDPNRIQARISVIMFVLHRTSVLIGNVASSTILGMDRRATNVSRSVSGCGARYCNEDLSGSFVWTRTDDDDDHLGKYANGTVTLTEPVDVDLLLRPPLDRPGDAPLFAFFALGLLSCLTGALLLAFGVQSLARLGIGTEPKGGKALTVFQLLTGVVRQFGDANFLLLLPLIVTSYANDYFWSADFSKAFVSCAIGVSDNGYVSVWSSVSSIACCCFFGWFNTKRSRLASFAIATVVQMGTGLVLLHYEPDADSFVALCVFSGVWYLGSGIRQSLVPALVSVVFIDDLQIAFSNYQLLGGVSGAIVYGLHNVVCLQTKVLAVIALNATAFLLYFAFEIRLRILKK